MTSCLGVEKTTTPREITFPAIDGMHQATSYVQKLAWSYCQSTVDLNDVIQRKTNSIGSQKGSASARVEQRDFDFIHIHKHNQNHTQIKNGGFIKNYKFEGIQENFWGNLGQHGLKTHNFEVFKNKL